MRQKMKQFMGILLSFLMVLGMTLGISMTAYADVDPYAGLIYTTVVEFDGKNWYLIAYDSDTVTLLTEKWVGASRFDSNERSNTYSGSTVETAVNNYYNNSISAGAKTLVSGNGMFLLTTALADTIHNNNVDVLKCNQEYGADGPYWWLSSPGSSVTMAAVVDGSDGDVETGGGFVGMKYGVRPALKLDLSKVTFDSVSKKFEPKKYPLFVGGIQVTSANASNITGSATPTASYDANNNTLTLNGINYTGDEDGISYDGSKAYGSEALTIVLNGTNTYKATDTKSGITVYYSTVKISGSGSLSVDCSAKKTNPIFSAKDITIESGTVTTKGLNGIYSVEDVIITGGNMTLSGTNNGIYAKNSIKIKNGTVTAAGDSDGLWASNGNVMISGGTVTATGKNSNGKGIGIYGKNEVIINGGTVNASGTEVGIEAKDSNVTISGSNVIASGPKQAIQGTVKNDIKGTGWTDVEGKEGKADIAINTEGQTLDDYKMVQFPKKKDPSMVKTAPTANSLKYSGSAQELVTGGTAEGGKMQYAIGTDDKTAPTNGWSTSIPTATEAGTYYVWYKVVGDDDHTDTEPACVTATIEENEKTEDTGTIEPVVDRKDNTPKAEVEGLDEDLATNVMNDDEKNKVKSGEKATLTLEMTNIDSSVPQEDKTLTENILSSSTARGKVGMYLDFSLWLRIGADYSRQLSETGGKQITVKLEVPENLRAPAGVTRKFFIFHIHKGAAKKLAETTNNTIPITVGEFSTFVLAYEDEEIDASTGFYSGLKISQKNGKIKVSWDKGEDASKYAVYAAYCGKEFASKPVKTTKSTSATFKKINGKKIDFSKNLKIYVTAYDASGKKIGNTVSAHFAGKNNKKYKNPKAVKLTTTVLTIEVGKSAKVKASVKMESGKKKALDDAHGAKLRYKTTNEKIATVDKNGNVTGVAAGTCEVYVYSKNGLAKKCTVTVK